MTLYIIPLPFPLPFRLVEMGNIFHSFWIAIIWGKNLKNDKKQWAQALKKNFATLREKSGNRGFGSK